MRKWRLTLTIRSSRWGGPEPIIVDKFEFEADTVEPFARILELGCYPKQFDFNFEEVSEVTVGPVANMERFDTPEQVAMRRIQKHGAVRFEAGPEKTWPPEWLKEGRAKLEKLMNEPSFWEPPEVKPDVVSGLDPDNPVNNLRWGETKVREVPGWFPENDDAQPR